MNTGKQQKTKSFNPPNPTALLWTTLLCLTACTQTNLAPDTASNPKDFYGNSTNLGPSQLDRKSSCQAGNNYQDYAGHQPDNKPIYSNTDDQQFQFFSNSLSLSPGDMLELEVLNGEGFSGRYIINPDGKIQLPLLPAIKAVGLTLNDLSKEVELVLVRNKLFRPNTARVSLRILQWSAIEVSVSGAVFEPGRVLINNIAADKVTEEKLVAFGDYSTSRFLSEALRAASGIRPDAKLEQITLIRNGWQVQVDLSGILSGAPVRDIPLVAGDQIIVPTVGCFQAHLVRPSQITPKGFRVFMSNLTETAGSNSNAAVGRFSSNLPYGTRLLQAAVSANCIGGTSWTNAPRRVMLASKNPISGHTEVMERSVEELIRNPNRGELNPYLMPNDSIACYDSDVTNFRDVARTVFEIFSPLSLF